MNYSIIKLSGQQFKVKEGDEFMVGRMDKGELPTAEVLLSVNDGKVEIGKPTLSSKVSLEIVNQEEKGEKLVVARFNAKSRYRKRIGFRPKYTRLKVTKLA